MPPLLVLLLACSPADRLGVLGSGVDSGVDSGVGSGVDSGVDFDPTAGIELVEIRDPGNADLEVEVWVYAFTEDHYVGHRDTEGGDPLFYIVRPTQLEPGSHPGLLWMHGGVGALEGDPTYGDLCTPDGIEGLAFGSVLSRWLLIGRLAQLGRVMVVPISSWCDLWSGLGPDDPVDPGHQSLVHVAATVEAAAWGLDGISLDTDDYAVWGQSLGGLGAFVAADHLGSQGIAPQALVGDSGPVNMLRMYDEGTMDSSWLDHFFGGPPTDESGTPTEFYANYARVDAPDRIRNDGFRVPVFAAFNADDQVTDSFHGPALEAAIDEVYAPEGIRSWALDYDHRAPGDLFHTQTATRQLPLIYATEAAIDFVQGREVRYFEADELATGVSSRRATASSTEDPAIAERLLNAVGEDAIVAAFSGADAPFFEAELPTEIPTDRALRLHFAIETSSETSQPEDLALTLRFLDGETVVQQVELTTSQLQAEESDWNSQAAQIAATTLDLDAATVTAAAQPRLQAQVSGDTFPILDGLWISWEP